MHTWLYALDGTKADELSCHRYLLGREALALQGFPVNWLDQVPAELQASDPFLRDLAGNAFSSTVFAALYTMMLACIPAPCVPDRHSDLDVLVSLLSSD
eukprot:903681-Lingulodinium_polyedra.AAC.1